MRPLVGSHCESIRIEDLPSSSLRKRESLDQSRLATSEQQKRYTSVQFTRFTEDDFHRIQMRDAAEKDGKK